MIPLADTHCHLLGGLDDGPRTLDEALEMCRIAWEEGTRFIAATGHQNERWCDVTRERILTAAEELRAALERIDAPMTVVPCGEVMISHELDRHLDENKLLSYGDAGKYLLIELPHGMFLDLRQTVTRLMARGLRPVLAHPERQFQFLYDHGVVEELIRRGCIVQVSADSLTDPLTKSDFKAVREWARRGVIHVIGSDGHSPGRRPPRMADAYRQMVSWVGAESASQVFGANGQAVLTGKPIRVPEPAPPKRRWFAGLW